MRVQKYYSFLLSQDFYNTILKVFFNKLVLWGLLRKVFKKTSPLAPLQNRGEPSLGMLGGCESSPLAPLQNRGEQELAK